MIGKLQLPCDSVVCVEDPSEYYLIRWGPEFCRHNQSKPMEMITTQVVSRTNKSFIIEATMLAGCPDGARGTVEYAHIPVVFILSNCARV